MAQITVSRGLKELSNLTDRINDALSKLVLVGIAVGQEPVPGFKSNNEFDEKAKAAHQSLNALIKRKAAIKSAVVVSNATTKVNVAGVEMTVADAIETKNTLIPLKKALLARMTLQLNQANTKIERDTEALKPRLDQYIQGLLGKDLKGKDDAVKDTTKTFMDTNKPFLIDPIDLKTAIENLSKEISEFELNLDDALDTSNVVTMIEIPEN